MPVWRSSVVHFAPSQARPGWRSSVVHFAPSQARQQTHCTLTVRCSSSHSQEEGAQQPCCRRAAILASSISTLSLLQALPVGAQDSSTSTSTSRVQLPDYTQPGPFQTVKLPRLEHTCSRCFPKCTGNKCLLRLSVFYPDKAASMKDGPPPLALLTGGFLVSAAAYTCYARRLASWGWTCILYDKVETTLDVVDDVLSVDMISDLMDHVAADPLLRRIASPDRTFLCGHSRGAKLSVLAAVKDPRVKAVCLLDPVDNTVYAPLGPGYPSAVQALKGLGNPGRAAPGEAAGPRVPLAVLGSGRGGDCVPKNANYRLFYEACTAPAWQLVLEGAGHFQFLDEQTALQRSVCDNGRVLDQAVRDISLGAVVMWAEVMVRRRQDMARASNGSADSTRGRDPGRQSASHNPALDGIQAIEQYAREVLLQTPQKRGKLQPNTAFAVQAQNKLLTQL